MATLETQLANSQILNSWKEIAGYLGRGLRTVQRWEHDLALPVRRPRGKSRSAVLAIRKELDEWIACRPQNPPEDNRGFGTSQPRGSVTSSVQESIEKSRLLWGETRQRRRELSAALHALVQSLHQFDVQNPRPAPNAGDPMDSKQDH